MKTVCPEYYSKFKCIASACPDSCCIGWQICLDEKTAQQYLTDSSTAVSTVAKQYMRGSKNSRYLALKNGRCPYLDDKNLCNVIKEKGDEFLCEVCYNHPRFDVENDGVLVKYLSLSCPEASRLFCQECKQKRIKFVGDDCDLLECLSNSDDVGQKIEKISSNQRFDELFSNLFLQMEYLDTRTKEILGSIKGSVVLKKLKETNPFYVSSLYDYFLSVNCVSTERSNTAIVNVIGVLFLTSVFDEVKSIYSYVKEIEHSEKNEKFLKRKVASPLFRGLFD